VNITSPAQYYQAHYVDIRDSRASGTIVSTDERGMVVPVGGAVNSRVGQTNPQWKDRIIKRVEAGSPYSRKVWSITPAMFVSQSKTLPSGLTANYKIEGFAYNLCTIGQAVVPNSFDSSVQNTALERLKKNLRSQSGVANTMAPLAEAKELHGLIHQATSFTYQFLQSLVELRKGRTRRSIRLMQDSWLAWNFGISPMVHDINEAGKAIANFIARQDSSYRIKGKASSKGMLSYDPGNFNMYAPFGCRYKSQGAAAYTLSYSYIGSFYSKLRSANDYTVFDHLGINLQNIPQTLWELTAFSWMADYFVNVGSYLEDMFYCPPGNLVYLSLTRKLEVTFNHSAKLEVLPNNPNNVFIVSDYGGVSSMTYLEMDRQVLATLPHVGLSFKSFDAVGAYAIPKLLNLLSVLKVNPSSLTPRR